MNKLFSIKCFLIVWALASVQLLANPKEADNDELLSLSLKELLAIPVDRPYQGIGIFQSDKHPVSKGSINIGLQVPLTSWPRYSAQLIGAADLATDFVNQHGGIADRPLAVIRADTDNTVNQSNRFARKLVESYQVQLLVGPVASDEAASVLKEINLKYRIPMMSFSASANELAQLAGGELFWRLLASNEQQVKALAGQLKQDDKTQRIAIIGNRDIYGYEMSEGIKKAFPDSAIREWLFSAKIDPNIYDFAEDIEQLKAFKPQSIVLLTKARLSDTILARLISRWLGKLPAIYTGDNFQFYDLSDNLANNTGLCVKTLISKNNINAKFKYQLESLTQSSINDLDAAYVFDSVMLFAMAKQLEQAAHISQTKAIRQLTGQGHPITFNDYPNLVTLYKRYGQLAYQGVSGAIHFDDTGNNVFAELSIQKSGLGCQ